MKCILDRQQFPPERIFLIVGVLHFLGRLAFQLLFQPKIHGAEDLDIARHLAAGEGFCIYDRGPTTAKGPLYPLMLAAFIKIGVLPDPLKGVVLLQHFLLSWIPLLLYRIGVLLHLPSIGLYAGFLFALHPSFLYYPTVLENTSIFIFGSVLWTVGVLQLKECWRWGQALLIGGWWGLMWIEKPVAWVPMTIVLLRLLPWKRWIPLLLPALFPIVLWSLRGYYTFGYLTWTKTYAGQHTFAYSWHPKMAVSPRYAVSESLAIVMDSLFLLPEKVGGPAFAKLGSLILQQEGIYKVIERTFVHAGIFWWIPPRYWHDHSIFIWIGRKLPVIFINILFILGLLYGLKHYPDLTLFILGTSLFFTIFYALNHVLNIRYRLDVEWLQLFVCAMAIEWLYLKKRT